MPPCIVTTLPPVVHFTGVAIGARAFHHFTITNMQTHPVTVSLDLHQQTALSLVRISDGVAVEDTTTEHDTEQAICTAGVFAISCSGVARLALVFAPTEVLAYG